MDIDGTVFGSVEITNDLLQGVDCCVILTDHSGFDYEAVAEHARLVVDSRNVIKGTIKAEVVSL